MRKREFEKMIKDITGTLKALPETSQMEALQAILTAMSSEVVSYELKVNKLGLCVICGKPVPESKRRWVIRMFCSDACKQKSSRDKLKAEKEGAK